MAESNLPPGWSKILHNGRIVYLSPSYPFQPQVKIRSRVELSEYHSKGRFLEVDLDQLTFASKRKRKEKKFEEDSPNSCITASNEPTEATVDENPVGEKDVLEVECGQEVFGETIECKISETERNKLENEQNKLAKAVAKLTLDPCKQVNNELVLEEAARRLNLARIRRGSVAEGFDIDSFKHLVKESETVEELTKTIWANSFFQEKFSQLFTSKILEQLLSLGSVPDNPLGSFPPDVNSNIYSDIMNLALDKAEDAILLLTAISKKHEDPISAKDVVHLSYSFSTLAEAASSKNMALKKLKSLSLRTSGLTNSGLDSFSSIGVAETSRSCRNDRDELASISEDIVKKHAKKHVPQFTFDNLDIRINNITHHLTLNFSEFEQGDTSHLPTLSESREEMLKYFKIETIDLQSDENSEIFKHFKYVTAITVGRLIGEEVVGMEWLLSALPNHYTHKNSETAALKALIHVDKPMYYQETKNADMFKIMKTLQLQYLTLVGEQALDQKQYFQDLKMIMSLEITHDEREAAEERIKVEVKNAGDLICHGDLLTKERFETVKRLAQSGVSAIERFEFMPIFRIGMFHLRMNKTIQDIECGMPVAVNVEDELSLGFFRTILGLNKISNDAENIKRCGEFEKHDQFLLEIGKEMLIEAFKCFIDKYKEPMIKTSNGAVELVLKFLSVSDIKYFWDPDNCNEKEKFDDILSSCKDTAGRTVLALVADKVEHEGDGMGIRAVRKAMIPYFLNKKIKQTSKYAIALLSDLVVYKGSSDRTKERIDLLATCNPSGGMGKGLARNQVNEHKVKLVKQSVRGLHSQLTDSVLSKTVLGSNVLSQLQEYDTEAMLLPPSGGGTSYKYMGEDLRLKIRAEIQKVKPFDLNRDKREYYDKPSGSVFRDLTVDRVERFLMRNKGNFKRSFQLK